MAIISDKMAGLVTFVATVETGSFSAASERLGTTPSAISKSVARLEQRLGAKLFRRSTRSLTLTIEGAAYFERAVPLLRGLEDAEEVVRSASTARGKLRITMPSELGRLLMNALTNRFMPQHPEITIGHRNDRSLCRSYPRRGMIWHCARENLRTVILAVRTLGELPMALVASPQHLKRNGRPRSLEDLNRATHLRYMLGGRPFPISFVDGSIVSPEGRLDLDSGFALRVAALNGIGIAYLLRCTVEARYQIQAPGGGSASTTA